MERVIRMAFMISVGLTIGVGVGAVTSWPVPDWEVVLICGLVMATIVLGFLRLVVLKSEPES